MKLEIGYKSDFDIRKAVVWIKQLANFSVLYLSDLHLNRFSQPLIEKIIACIDTQNPDIILLGGDYVDSKRGFAYFEQLLKKLSHRQHVFAIAGNHDYFFDIQSIKNICEKHNITWLENQSNRLEINGLEIEIVGSKPQKKSTNVGFRILCLHQPIDISPFQMEYDLVFAGHLHGCQFVFWETPKGLFPGKFFYRWNILKAQFGNCLYLVSKGLGDTLPIRFNCKRDVVMVEVKNEK